MNKIILFGTRHSSLGNCNKYDLAGILRKLNPDVIFIEHHDKDKFFENGNLESSAIYYFLSFIPKENHPIIIPVDIDIVQDEFFDRMQKNFLEPVFFYNTEFQLLQFHINHSIETFGFKYINSIEGENDDATLNELQKQTVKEMNDETITAYCNEWYQIEEKRNNAFIENIYGYCEKNDVKNGIFLVGYGHRKKLKDLIRKRDSNLIEWDFSKTNEK